MRSRNFFHFLRFKRNKFFFTTLFCVIAFTPDLPGLEGSIEVTLKVFPLEYTLFVDDRLVNTFPKENFQRALFLTQGKHILHFKKEGFKDKLLFLSIDKPLLIEEKMEKEVSSFHLFAEIFTGRQPKCVEFSPDGEFFFTALLDDTGIDVFRTEDFSYLGRIAPPEKWAKHRGFVEICFFSNRKELWVSQMTTGSIHIFNLENFEYIDTVHTKGVWTKVILPSSDESKAYVSNWESWNISVIETETRKVVQIIPLSGIPRGMHLSPDERFLYAGLYDKGSLEKIDLSSGKIAASFPLRGGSKRHIVRDDEKKRFYISDMYWGTIHVFDFEKDTLIKEIPIDHNPNTISLSKDGRYLFISTRGKNNPETYLKKGFVFGKIYVLDTESLTIKEWFWGKNQPTGVDLSPDGRFLAYSNFKDNTIEIYWNDLSGF